MLITNLTFSQGEKKVEKSFEELIKPYIEKLLDGIEKGVDWTLEQIPEVIQQYLIFEAVQGWFMIIVCIIISVVSVKIGKKAIEEDWDGGGSFYGGMIISITNIFVIITFFWNIFNTIKVTFFPKLYLVEKFIQLL